MVNLDELDLVKEFGIPKSKWTPHPYKELFEIWKIPQDKIANVLEVSQVTIHYWLSGKQEIPKKRQEQLTAFVHKILEWEKENGKVFNSEKSLRKAIVRK